MFARPLDMSLAEQSKEGLDLGERFEVAARRLREANIECGRILARLAEIDGWHSAGSVCEDDFGERYGMPAKDARMLLGLGLAIKAAPYLEQSVLSGRMTLREASLLGQVLPDPRMQREGDDWVGWALTESTRTFENRVRKRREEVGLAGEETMGISLYVRRTVMEDFRRARVIASRKAGQALTEGQTLGVVVDTYLEAFDPARVTPGRRTLLDTAFVNGRYVPPAVQREIIERQGEKCAVPFCDHLMFLTRRTWWSTGAGARARRTTCCCCAAGITTCSTGATSGSRARRRSRASSTRRAATWRSASRGGTTTRSRTCPTRTRR